MAGNGRTAGEVSARFARGMRPLAIGTAVIVALAAPVADFLLERHDVEGRAAREARVLAARIGPLSPSLQAARRQVLAELPSGAETEVEVVAAGARPVAIAGPGLDALPWPRLTATAELTGGGTVRVTLGEAEWLPRDLLLLAVFGALGLALGLALYLFPLHLFREQDLVGAFAWAEVAAAEEERRRLSRELHDGLGQTLGAAAVALARLRTSWEEAEGGRMSPTEAVGARGASEDGPKGRPHGPPDLEEGAKHVDAALEELRRAVRFMRAPALDDLGLGAAVEALARGTERAGLAARVEIGELPELPPDLEQAAYRLAQEALANVVRHGRAAHVRVALAAGPGSLRLEVEDDGCGFPAHGGGGMGLAGARERAAKHGGSLEVVSSPGKGTRLTAVLPLGA